MSPNLTPFLSFLSFQTGGRFHPLLRDFCRECRQTATRSEGSHETSETIRRQRCVFGRQEPLLPNNNDHSPYNIQPPYNIPPPYHIYPF